jgi:Ca2+ transporting ATPase
VKNNKDCPNQQTLEMVSKLIAINTMDETTVEIEPDGQIRASTGNPTEVALLALASSLGSTNYRDIRESTRGRCDKGDLSEFLVEGKQFQFTSARKMMSWAVPLIQGGYRIYCKGASEVLVARCNYHFTKENSAGDAVELNDASRQGILRVGEMYARRGMRTLALAYRDLPDGVDFEAKSDRVVNADGSARSK